MLFSEIKSNNNKFKTTKICTILGSIIKELGTSEIIKDLENSAKISFAVEIIYLFIIDISVV